jgi:hypothetical protein
LTIRCRERRNALRLDDIVDGFPYQRASANQTFAVSAQRQIDSTRESLSNRLRLRVL